MVADNANPIIHSAAGPSRRSKKRFDALDLSDDDEWDRRGRGRALGGDLSLCDEGAEEEIDGEEIYGEWRLDLSAGDGSEHEHEHGWTSTAPHE